jgi:iron complex outermembrane receptor protein
MQRAISSAGLAGCILVILFSITSETAWAQADITPETVRAQGTVLEEITITARKRDESLQDIPMAVSAWSATELDRAMAINFEDVAKRTPGVQFSDQANQIPGRYNTSIRFRGMDTNQRAASQQTGSAFIDGVYTSTGVSSIGFEDIERIEIVRGPQSALFGRSTFGGAVNYITKTPSTEEYSGRVSALIAQDGTYDVSLAHEGPIVEDKLAYRLSVRGFGTDGQYTSNADGGALGREQTESIQGVLYATPTENFSARFRFFYSEDDDGAPAAISLGGVNSNRAQGPSFHNCFATIPGLSDQVESDYFCGAIPVVDADGFATGNTSLNEFEIEQFTAPAVTDTFSGEVRSTGVNSPSISSVGLRRDSTRLSLVLDYDFATEHTLTAVLGYNEMDVNWIRDFEFFPVNNWHSRDPQSHEDFSAELRFVSPQDRRFRYLIGVSYFDVDYVQQGNGGLAIWNPDSDPELTLFGASNPSPIIFLSADIPTEGAETIGIFGSLGFDITDNLSLDVEARWQEDEVSQDNPATPGTDFSADFENFLPRVTLSWGPRESTTLWATYAEGNLPGFFNSDAAGLSENELAQLVAQIGSVGVFNDEETLENYEIGWRQQWLGGRFFYALVGYFMDWEDQKTRQGVVILDDADVPFVLNVSSNAGSSELKGIELEGAFSLERWSGNFMVNWADGEFTEFECGFTPFLPDVNCAGNTPARYPEWSAFATTTWTDTFNTEWDYFVRLDGTYTGEAFIDESNFAWTEDFWVFDLRGGFEKEGLRVEAFVTNIFDDDNYLAGARGTDFSGPGFLDFTSDQGVHLTPPEKRRFGVKVVFEF